ncbi:hypothetical protein MGYG_06111 [Nannizzia gypsea CBS 118893]|uniref:Uncharacterized protein n=1 Tax=Arthroderma gypseum (strain ATCC MYA-4604 / CBS 118893) TaxID=535722 RepID=E4V0H9_ARTGP|nr:hypothetical protein MGYG_06111 [Nannizzia gypsea CBS 118893]EFR03116.1 hypothetical protein MGYG_06111 [Nannizzia gypsea CBS 118893]
MAQGAIKKSKPTQAKKPTSLGPKRGAKTIAPKKAKLIKQQKLVKKLTSGLTGKTERLLAEKAGHLELLKGTRKDKKGDNKQAAKK